MPETPSAPDRAGWSIPRFCEECGFSRAHLYNLPQELQPKSVRLGRRRIIREQPAEFLARVAAAQEAANREAK